MSSEKKVRFADGTLDHMEVETSIFSPEHPELGVAVLSEEHDGMFIARLLELAQDEESFYPIQDLAAFKFDTKREMKDFIKRLPEMSGLEMLLLLNPFHPVGEQQ
ncbi:hypothetical protein ACDX78_21875 [Virgibacillus oceani]